MTDSFDSPPKKGMGTGLKILIGVLVGGVVLSLVCCGGGAWFFGSRFKVTQDAAQIGTIKDEIATINLPPEYQPQAGVNMNFGMSMKMVTYSKEGGEPAVMLMQMNVPGASSDQMRDSLQQQRGHSGQAEDENLEWEITSRPFTIDGVERQFQFMTATGEDGTVHHRVQGTFPSRGGTGMVMITATDDNWDEEEVTGILESISTK